MVLEQEGRCRICGNPAQGLEVDHLHGTHIVRGLLCGMCNRGIGMFRDNPVVLRAATEFIETAGRGK
jgi:hypothetical protein